MTIRELWRRLNKPLSPKPDIRAMIESHFETLPDGRRVYWKYRSGWGGYVVNIEQEKKLRQVLREGLQAFVYALGLGGLFMLLTGKYLASIIGLLPIYFNYLKFTDALQGAKRLDAENGKT